MEIHALFFRQIKNRHGQTLAIMNNGEVRGVAEEAPANKNAVLEFIPTEPPGAYRIRGIQANLYLAMDEKGKLYGESDRTEGSTIFAEHTQNKVRNTRHVKEFCNRGRGLSSLRRLQATPPLQISLRRCAWTWQNPEVSGLTVGHRFVGNSVRR